jgi:lysophospholipase L1-like esterase
LNGFGAGPSSLLAVILVALIACERGAPSGPPPSSGAAPPASAPKKASAGPPGPAATLYLEDAAPAAPPATEPSAEPVASSAVTPARQGDKSPCRVALIGDSLTDFRAGGGGYVRYLEARCPRSTFANFAKGGAMVNQMRARQLPSVELEPASRFTHLVVFGGVNDLYSDETAGRTPAKIESDLEVMYAAGKRRGLRVVALTVAPWGGYSRYFNERRAAATRLLNAWILEQPSKGSVDVVVDAYSVLSCGDPDRICPRFEPPFRDGLHFGTLGQEALGQALYDAEFKGCS